ncbi:alpha/beta hydrolase [Brevibacterium casei]|uniref:alpha/beta hydrolase n=1 Tax=Brevibacterium casei TaxID=33889 RepID=UPI003EED4E92
MTEHTTPSGEPTVVLIHGAFANSLTFAPLQAALAGHGVRSAALDLPGHGFAASVPAGYQSPQDLSALATSPSAMAGVSLDDAVESLAEALVSFRRSGPVIVLAHSRGGVALTALANAHPDLVDHLVYVSAWAPVDLEAATYNGEPEMAGVDSTVLASLLVGNPAELGALRCNFRAAAGEQLAALKNLFAADRSDDEFLTFLSTFQTDEGLDAGGADDRAQAGTWGTIPRTYVRLGEDRSIPPAMQDRLIAEGDALTPDYPYRVRTLPTSHLGWLIDPAEAAAQIADIVAEVRAG